MLEYIELVISISFEFVTDYIVFLWTEEDLQYVSTNSQHLSTGSVKIHFDVCVKRLYKQVINIVSSKDVVASILIRS